MSKDSRSGGKYTGNHTTLSSASALVCDIANKCVHVTKISPGFIKAGLKSANGNRRVKFTIEEGALLMSIRDNASNQEVHVYAKDLSAAQLAIARGVRDAGLAISFKRES